MLRCGDAYYIWVSIYVRWIGWFGFAGGRGVLWLPEDFRSLIPRLADDDTSPSSSFFDSGSSFGSVEERDPQCGPVIGSFR